MNKTWENKLSMYHAVNTVLKNNAPAYADIPALSAAAQSMENLITDIGVKSSEFDKAIRGKTETKAQAEDDLVEALMPVGSALWAYASGRRDQEMMARANINDSMLRRMRDTELLAKAKSIHTEATAQVSELADLSITQATLDDLAAKIKAFGDALGSRESSVAERSGAKTALSDLFSQADSLLDRIDAMMQLLRAKATQFFNEYFAARVIKDVGIRHRPEAPPAQASTT